MDEVTVTKTLSELDADQLVLLLQAEGIPSYHTGGSTQYGPLSEIEVRVPAEHAARARELVEAGG